ncbi:MAG TPA: glycosyltransferase family 4 protein [Stellaceae bacterium]|nr:glycosyltransferase family 4 protein [Stellaceae bacterium]
MTAVGSDPSTGSAPAKSRPPAVLQVLPSLITGGVERGTIEMAQALAAAGWQAVVASSGGPLVREIERAGVRHVTLPLASKNPLVMRGNIGRLAEVIERHTIDIVHARSRAPAWSALWAARRTGRHFLTTFHNAYGVGSRLKHIYNSVMAKGERVIAISDFVGAHVAQVYGVTPDRLRVVPRGVDLARFNPERVGAERLVTLARQWQLPDGAPVVILPGRLTRWKGQLVLIEAIALLGRGDVRCLFVGSGDARYRRELEAHATKLGLGAQVEIVDECRDMPAAYMLADVVVSASTSPEGFGRVVAEGQAMGRPVVATNHGGARETVVPGSTGWLVAPGDARALADAIGDALRLTPEQRLAHAARAIDHVRRNFDTATMAARTLDVYEEVLFPAAIAKRTAQAALA